MNGRNWYSSRLSSLVIQFIAICGILSASACGQASTPKPVGQPPDQGTPAAPPEATPTIYQAEVTFQVDLPASTPAEATVDISILDEVTGLPLNTKDYQMQMLTSRQFTIRIPLALGSVVKYRYFLEGSSPLIEYTASGRQVRYRLVQVSGPTIIQDVISSWKDPVPGDQLGRVTGQVVDESNNSPIPGLLVAAGGSQAVTVSDGSFTLDNIPAGTHNMVVYSLDGRFRPFQQGVKIVPGLTTPAQVRVSQAPPVNITFHVTLPPENVVGLPVRMAGNLVSLGNTFTDLNGGLSTVASRMPMLTPSADGKYSLTLSLPAGTDLQYKYTLGDGFWNGELSSDGKMKTRELIVPDHDTVIDDRIETWRSPNLEPVSFEITAPTSTPAGETVSIQLNPYDWTVPLPMWSLGDGRWLYILYNPLHLVGPVGYRFCRNDQCNASSTPVIDGTDPSTLSFKPDAKSQTFKYDIAGWTWWQPSETPTTVAAAEINPRGPDFTAGLEFSPNYQPSWLPYLAPNYQALHSIGGNWVFLSPTWSNLSPDLPAISPDPAIDPLWFDLTTTIGYARNQGLQVGLFPRPILNQSADTWWGSAPRDSNWWNGWFEQYRRFLLHHADLANQTGSGALVIGGDWVLPAFPGGKLPDSTSSGVPQDADARWTSLIHEIRTHFTGKIIFAIPYPTGIVDPPEFLKSVDEIYLLWGAPTSDQLNPTEADLETEFNLRLASDVSEFHDVVGKPILLGVSFPSATGAAAGCVTTDTGECVKLSALDRPNPDIAEVQANSQEQVNLYNAVLASVNQQDWISGIVSRGYYPPVPVQDKSISVHGKPAWDVLWYWFPKLLEAKP